jgi:Cu(I)/Ag(I) efflux system membrane fusion protein
MKRAALFALVAVTVATAAGAGTGYWLGLRKAAVPPAAPSAEAATPKSAPAAERKVLYYRNPMGLPDTSPVPKKDSMGMDYVPVYAGEEAGGAPKGAATAGAPETPKKKRVLYYRNPMGLPDTSPVPKKDSMGMDYIAVYEGEEQEDGSAVKVSPDRVQRLGVRTEPVTRRNLMRPVRAVGTVQFDERRLAVVSTKFEGWIEKLHVNTTGESVKRGQTLMDVYSPELVQAQQEYVLAWKAAGATRTSGASADDNARRLIDGALQRLRNLDFPADHLQRLQRDGQASRLVTVRSPFPGVVIEKKAVEGMRFMAGEPLYRIADVATVWVIAEVFEQDLANVEVGQSAKVVLKAYPGRSYQGRATFVYPTVSRETRTAKVRIEMPNPMGEIKADMYANVEIETPVGQPDTLAVPDSAVIDSGTRQVVLIERGEGKYEPRVVHLGRKGENFIEVLDGVAAGERVVVSANFLIDAESNLRAALRAFSSPDGPGAGK